MRSWLIISMALAVLSLAGCEANQSEVRSVLLSAGYSGVELSPPGFLEMGCGSEQRIAANFHAKGPTGIPVHGIVCSSGYSDYSIHLKP